MEMTCNQNEQRNTCWHRDSVANYRSHSGILCGNGINHKYHCNKLFFACLQLLNRRGNRNRLNGCWWTLGFYRLGKVLNLHSVEIT